MDPTVPSDRRSRTSPTGVIRPYMTRTDAPIGARPALDTSDGAADRIGPRLDRLTTTLDSQGYHQSSQRIAIRLLVAAFDGTAPLTQSAIAEKTNLDVRTVREQLGALVEDGYVDRYPNSDDPRERLYRLRSLDVAADPR